VNSGVVPGDSHVAVGLETVLTTRCRALNVDQTAAPQVTPAPEPTVARWQSRQAGSVGVVQSPSRPFRWAGWFKGRIMVSDPTSKRIENVERGRRFCRLADRDDRAADISRHSREVRPGHIFRW